MGSARSPVGVMVFGEEWKHGSHERPWEWPLMKLFSCALRKRILLPVSLPSS